MSLLNKASLIQIPSGYKDGTLYSAKPTNGDGDFTFSRGSNLAATRVNSNGLIEKGRENRLLQSNNFDTWPYGPASATVTSGFEGYDGSNDAWKITSTLIGGETRVRQSQTFTTGEVITLSVYMKKGNVNFGIVRTYAITGGGRAWFDLENGTVATENSGINGSIEDVGNGWYRCSIWGVITTTGAVDIAPAPADGDYLADAVGEFIYIQDSQLESGLVATDYIETGASTAQAGILEDMPRLDYSGGATCPSLLLEPQRTNLIPHSEWIGGWTAANSATIDGVQSFTLPSSLSRIQAGSIGNPSGDFVFYAVFDSADIGKTIKLAYYDVTAAGWNQGTDITIDSNGRAERTISTGSNIVGNVAFYGKSTSESYTLKYCQFESGSYATSYIPTYGSAVTRNEDLPSLFNFQSKGLFGDTSGSIFYEFENVQDLFKGWSISNTKDRYQYVDIAGSANGYFRFRGYEQSFGLQIVNLGATSQIPVGSTTKKLCITWDANEFSLYGDGALLGSVSINDSIAVNSISNYNGNLSNTGDLLREMIWFPTRLSNQEAIDLTTI